MHTHIQVYIYCVSCLCVSCTRYERNDNGKKWRKDERERTVYFILWECISASLILGRTRERERGENDDELVDSGSQLGVLNPAKSPIPLCLP